MGTDELNAGLNPAMDLHLIQGGVEILLVASCYRNRDNPWPWPNGPRVAHDHHHGSCADLTYLPLHMVIFNEDASVTKWFTEGSSKEY